VQIYSPAKNSKFLFFRNMISKCLNEAALRGLDALDKEFPVIQRWNNSVEEGLMVNSLTASLNLQNFLLAEGRPNAVEWKAITDIIPQVLPKKFDDGLTSRAREAWSHLSQYISRSEREMSLLRTAEAIVFLTWEFPNLKAKSQVFLAKLLQLANEGWPDLESQASKRHMRVIPPTILWHKGGLSFNNIPKFCSN